MPYVVIISSIIILPLIAYSFDFDNSLINGQMKSSDSTLAGFIDYLCINDKYSVLRIWLPTI